MALRALAGKLRGVLGRQAASGALTETCELCGKPSSRITSSVGQKSGGIEDDLRRMRMREYIIRTIAVTSSAFMVWMMFTTGVDYLYDDENLNKLFKSKNSRCNK